MTSRFVDGILGNDANDGLAAVVGGGHGPKLTLTGAEDSPVAAGDVVYVRPTVYREPWTWDVSGANTYTTGTVTVTNGSTTVQGAGTLWLANVAANYMFHCILFASGADGVTNGTATFTSAAGNFQANMVGYIIQINTKGAYKIANVGGANTITLSDPNGLGWPAAGVGLTYSVMSGMGPFDVASVTGNTTLDLDKPWNGPTLSGLVYITYNPIRYIGDVCGQIWGVGGTVRITGSDNDQTATRANCINAGTTSYRILRGFECDIATTNLIVSTGSSYVTIEDCTFQGNVSAQVLNFSGALVGNTFRRCYLIIGKNHGINLSHTVTYNNSGYLISNCILIGGYNNGIRISRIGGVTIRNCVLLGLSTGVVIVTAPTVGQTINVSMSILESCYTALQAGVVGQLTNDFCDLVECNANYLNVTAGANNQTYPVLFSMPILTAGQAGVSGFRLPPPMLGELSQWSQVKALTGFGEAPADLLGLKRPTISTKNSWGAVQYQNQLRDTATVRSGTSSLKFTDAGRQQIIIPVEAINTTISVYVYREANYAGTNPQMILKQPGQADIVVTDAGAAGVWNLLTYTWIPAVVPNWIAIELVSNNTALAGAYGCFFDDLLVRPLSTDTMEAWSADVQHINYAEELPIPTAAFSPVGGTIVGA